MSPHPLLQLQAPQSTGLGPSRSRCLCLGPTWHLSWSFVNSGMYRNGVCPGFLSIPPGSLGCRALEFRSGQVGTGVKTLLKGTLPEPSGGEA